MVMEAGTVSVLAERTVCSEGKVGPKKGVAACRHGIKVDSQKRRHGQGEGVRAEHVGAWVQN